MIDTVALNALHARFPQGYTARPFADADRETLVALRNVELHPVQHQSAAEWRLWERLMPDPSQFRVVVEGPGGEIAAAAFLGAGGAICHPDGALSGGVFVAPGARGRGIGSALLALLEAEAARRAAPRFLSSVNEAHGKLAWAEQRGFREIGRRIDSYVELAAFDPRHFAAEVERARAGGIRLATAAELLAGRDAEGRAHPRGLRGGGGLLGGCPLAIANPALGVREVPERRGEPAVGARRLVARARRRARRRAHPDRAARRGVTAFTGTVPAYRGRGIAFALKVEALARAKARGLRAMLTTNDEPNRPMRGINARLGYRLPAEIMLEKRLR